MQPTYEELFTQIKVLTQQNKVLTQPSISLNIAEGAGEFAGNEKSRFYRMAKRLATECAGVLDLCSCLKLVEETKHLKGRELLLRIVAMLTKMAQVCSNAN